MSRRCVRHHRGRADYNLRGQTVQPIVGQIKTCQKLTTMSRRGVQQRVAARRRRPQPAQAAFAPMQQLTEERHRKPMITIGPASFPPPTFPGLPQTVYATGSRMHSAIPVHQLGMSGVRLQAHPAPRCGGRCSSDRTDSCWVSPVVSRLRDPERWGGTTGKMISVPGPFCGWVLWGRRVRRNRAARASPGCAVVAGPAAVRRAGRRWSQRRAVPWRPDLDVGR